ncbi:hypothetical protein SO802_017508 [Lithocarpus litseifolius]|uniref:Uncharacterized protein n=1 Tax=Lithocarpus litseifolius TaxID=425828 RepID=A0AAW2CN03_9ROSI
MASYKHCHNLVDLLNQIQVLTTTTSQDLNAMIGSISRELTISYSGKDLMKKGKHHNDPLHITVDAKSKRIPMVLIDDGSALYACPLKTASFLGLGKIVKKAITQVPIIPTTTPPFGLGYKLTDDDLLEMARRMARAKAKAKGLPCPPKPLKPYTFTLNGKFVKAGDSQRYWGFPKPRFNPESRTMVLGFELLFDCNNRLPKPKKEDINWVPTDWADYMDPNVMTTLQGDANCNIEEEEYWEACQHALKSPYEVRISDEDEERGEDPSDSDEGSNSKSDSSNNNSSNDDGDGEDDSNDHSDDGVDYYDGDIEDDAEVEPINMENGTENEEYELENVLDAVREEVEEADNIDYDDYTHRRPSDWSCITDASSKSGKQDLFGEWMGSIECLDAYVTDKPTDMEIDGEGTYYMDKDPMVLMLKEEGTNWEPPAIVEDTTD